MIKHIYFHYWMNTVQASIAANTYVISGPNEAKSEYILSLRC